MKLSPKLPAILIGLLVFICSEHRSAAQTLPPTTINYQGRVSVAGAPVEGTGYFKFLLYAPDKRLWSNDDSHTGSEPIANYEPTGAMSIPVTGGLFATELGSGTMPMISPSVLFDGTGNVRSEVYFRVWFSGSAGGSYVKLSPDRRLTSVPFSLVAGTVAKGSVTIDKLANGAVGGAQLQDGVIDSDKLADSAVLESKLAPGAVNTAQLKSGAVTGDRILNGTIQLEDLSPSLQTSLVLPGTIVASATSAVPPGSGWLVCDGTAVNRTTYAALFAAIGTTHGQGDGTTTFNLPDYRGRFLRGADLGASRDPDAASRTAMAVGGAVGNAVGSIQADELKNHTHLITGYNGRTGQTGVGAYLGNNALDTNSGATGGSETRPKNAYVNYLIKY